MNVETVDVDDDGEGTLVVSNENDRVVVMQFDVLERTAFFSTRVDPSVE